MTESSPSKLVPPLDSWLAEQLAWAYGYAGFGGGLPFPWDFRLDGDVVRAGIRRYPELGFQLRLWPGTEDPHEWLLNVSAWPSPAKDHPTMGRMPWGFLDGMLAATGAMDRALDSGLPVLDVAHSRGCPHAVVNALTSQQKPARLVLMGCPRPGTTDLVRAWQRAQVPAVSYRTVNAHAPREQDFVTKVPFYVADVAPFCAVMAWTDLAVVPKPDDPWMLLALHHEDTMYLPGIRALERRAR